MVKFDISKMNEYLDSVKNSKELSKKWEILVTRVLYEDRSIIAGNG